MELQQPAQTRHRADPLEPTPRAVAYADAFFNQDLEADRRGNSVLGTHASRAQRTTVGCM